MSDRQRFYIYGRKEVGVLFSLGVVIAAFAFTFGVHLGKKVGLENSAGPGTEANPVGTTGDKTPGNQELAEQQKSAQEAAEETLNQSLHDEVAKRGIKLDTTRQVDLPKDPKVQLPEASAEGARPEASAPAAGHGELKPSNNSSVSESHGAAKGSFSIQVGSYPSQGEAKIQSDQLTKKGLKPFLKEVQVPKIGVRYRLFVGGYESKVEAETAAKSYKAKGSIQSYVIGKL